MTNKKPAFMLFALALAAAVVAPAHASGPAYPDKPIRFVVTFPPGGGTDLLARMLATELTKTLGQNVLVDNKPGASGNIGADLVAKSPPDGLTLLIVNSSYAINPGVFAKMPFNPAKDLRGVVQFSTTPSVISVPANSPIKNMADLVAAARGGKSLSGASCGSGTPQHLAIGTLEIMAKAKLNHIGYKGCAPAMTDTIAGQVDFGVNTLANSIPMVTSNKIRPLAVTGKSRVASLPDVPTVAEQGFAGFDVEQWFGILAPAQTPDAILAKIHQEVARIVTRPDIQAKLTGGGFTVALAEPSVFQRTILHDIERFAKVSKEIGLSLEN